MSRKPPIYTFEKDFHPELNFVMNARQKHFYGLISEMAQIAGTYLLSPYYDNEDKPFWFPCSKCGTPHYNRWHDLRRGKNKSFCCFNCMSNKSPDLTYIRDLAWKSGTKLTTEIYENAHQNLNFICSCGRQFSFIWNSYQQHSRTNFFCKHCSAIARYNPSNIDFTGRISDLGGWHWYNLGRLFFNVKNGYQGVHHHSFEPYSFHHFYNYGVNKLLRSSLTNGFPVFYKSVHDPSCGLYSQIIHSKKWFNPESWNTEEFQTLYPNLYQLLKLPYHTYPNFRFWDLTQFLVTEIIIPSTDLDKIKHHEKYWCNKGIIYIPINYQEYVLKEDRIKLFSQIRDELRQFIPEIDQYTGVGFNFKQYLKSNPYLNYL
jgi:predicted SprT family Zn-dependent metalloprotease